MVDFEEFEKKVQERVKERVSQADLFASYCETCGAFYEQPHLDSCPLSVDPDTLDIELVNEVLAELPIGVMINFAEVAERVKEKQQEKEKNDETTDTIP